MNNLIILALFMPLLGLFLVIFVFIMNFIHEKVENFGKTRGNK
jgi:hypothetical protein